VQVFNSKCLINIIDNTKTGSILDCAKVIGYSHVTSVAHPNCGKIINSSIFHTGDIVYFFDYSSIETDTGVIISESNVFLCNNELVKSGVIVKRLKLSQNSNGFVFREQEWFYVTKSSCDIPEGSLIVARSNSAYQFNHDNEQYYFVPDNNVLFNFYDNALHAGPGIVLDKVLDTGIFDNKKSFCGEKYYFSKSFGKIIFKGIEYHIADKSSIYATT